MSAVRPERDFAAPAIVDKWQRVALVIAVLGTVGAIIGWIIEPDYFYRAYLVGYMWCLEATLGSVGILMLYHISGGAWGTVIRRTLEAAMSNIWLMAVLFIPILIGVHHLYPWSRPEVINSDHEIARVAASYLSLRFWIFRAVLYFLAFGLLVAVLNQISRRQDRLPETNFDRRLRGISGGGIVLYMFVTFFMYVDWMMSTMPLYVSMVYPLIFNAGQGLSTICLAVIVAALLVRYEPMRGVIKPDQFLDNGKIMLTFVMVWGWWSYGQWIIYWSGNKPEEISWYLDRTRGGWNIWAFVIILVHFCIPFALLLSRSFKSDARKLSALAVWLLAARYMEIVFYIIPGFPSERGRFHYSWLFAVVPLALAGLWVAAFFRHLKKRPLLALHDAHVRILVEEGHEHEHV